MIILSSSIGICLSELSSTSDTSQNGAGFLFLAPLKISFSSFCALIALAEVTPNTKVIASMIFELWTNMPSETKLWFTGTHRSYTYFSSAWNFSIFVIFSNDDLWFFITVIIRFFFNCSAFNAVIVLLTIPKRG